MKPLVVCESFAFYYFVENSSLYHCVSKSSSSRGFYSFLNGTASSYPTGILLKLNSKPNFYRCFKNIHGRAL